MKDEDGCIQHWVSIQRDVTEQRMMRRTLAENKERFQALAEETSDVISRVDKHGTFLYLSPAIEFLLGYRPETLIGRAFHPYIHPEDRPTIQSRLQDAFEGDRVQVEHRLEHAAGHYVWVESAARVTGQDEGTATVVVSTRPIGRRKRAEQALDRERNLLQNIFDASPAAILVFDPQGTITFANERAEAVLGWPVDVIVGTSISDPEWRIGTERGETPPDGEPPFAQVIKREISIEGAEHTIATPEGKRRLLSINGAPLHNESDQLLGAVFVVEDITERRRRKAELVEAKETAEAAREVAEEMSALKSALLANMSHEIRTPLTSIIGFSEVLDGMDFEPPVGRFIQMIRRGGDRLLTTLNSVFDLSQLEAGAMTLTPEDVAVGSLLRDIAAGFQLRAREANVELTVDTPESGITAHLNAGAFERIASNLISNAIKFTGEGSAPGGRVAVRLDASGDPLILTVADTGVGIDEAFLPHLFDTFKQESTGDARGFEGTGLGLTIIGELVDLMGGTIEVESEKGEGTTFTVTLPRQGGEAPRGDAPPSARSPGEKREGPTRRPSPPRRRPQATSKQPSPLAVRTEPYVKEDFKELANRVQALSTLEFGLHPTQGLVMEAIVTMIKEEVEEQGVSHRLFDYMETWSE